MEKLKMQSSANNRQLMRLLELFPNCSTEIKSEDGSSKIGVDFDILRQELSDDIVEGPQERYRLDWPGKREALNLTNKISKKTLKPACKESVFFNETKNIFIQGDNLDVLKLLQESYLNSIKIIYVDPPYNTKNDFLYNDKFSVSNTEYLEKSGQISIDGENFISNKEFSGKLHSMWLSMMYPRLKLAKNLLREDGAIFISIDDNEVHNLILICNEIFGVRNFLGLIPVIRNKKGINSGEFLAVTHEYIIVYKKENFISRGLPKLESSIDDYDQICADGRRFKWDDLRKRGGEDRRADREDMFFPIFVDTKTGGVSLKETEKYNLKVLPKLANEEDGRWRWSLDRVKNNLQYLRGRKVQGGVNWMIERAVFLTNDDGTQKRDMPKSVWEGPEFSTDHATTRLNSLISGIIAKQIAPKPVDLIKRILELGMNSGDLFLDLFAGSGTSADAIFEYSVENTSALSFILIQADELCAKGSGAASLGFTSIADICKERIRRSGLKIQQELKERMEQLLPGSEEHEAIKLKLESLDIGFRVLKVDSSNMEDIYYKPDQLTQENLALQVDNVKKGRTPEDLLFQVLIDWGVDLALPIVEEEIEGKKVFFVADNALAACFDTGLNEAFCKALAKRQPLRAIFRDSGYASDAVKINIEQIFKAISPHTELKTL